MPGLSQNNNEPRPDQTSRSVVGVQYVAYGDQFFVGSSYKAERPQREEKVERKSEYVPASSSAYYDQDPENLPTSVPWFVERPEIVEKIDNYFSSFKDNVKFKSSATRLTLTAFGKGGVGKTQVALYYINNTGQKYSKCFWFYAGNEKALETQYIFLFRRYTSIGSLENQNVDPILYVKNWLEDNPGWLIVYDNVDDYQQVERFLPQKGGHILFTSRYDHFPIPNLKIVRIFEMTNEQPKQLIIRMVNAKKREDYQIDYENLDALVKIVGTLPLALTQASAYIAKNSISIKKYLELYGDEKTKFLSDQTFKKLHGQYSDPVAITWNVTFDKIKKNGKAYDMLLYCAYFEPHNISKKILMMCLKNKSKEYTESNFIADFGELLSYDMISENSQQSTITIHRLIQDVLKIKNYINEEAFIGNLVNVLQEFIELHRDEHSNIVMASIHLNHLLDTILEKKGYENIAQRIADLFSKIHIIFYKKKEAINFESGMLSGTIRPFIKVMKIFKNTEWLRNKVIIDLNKMAEISFNWNNLSRLNGGISSNYSVDLSDTYVGIEIEEKIIKDYDNRYLNIFDIDILKSNLASLKRMIKNHHSSKSLLDEAIPNLERKYGFENQIVATAYLNQGCNERELQNYEKSVDYLKKVVNIYTSHIRDHPATLLANLELSISLNKINKISESKRLYFANVHILKDVYSRFYSDPKKFNKIFIKLNREYHSGIAICHEILKCGCRDDILMVLNRIESQKDSWLDTWYGKAFDYLYNTSPINFSNLTGFRYLHLPKLKGEYINGINNFSNESLLKILFKASKLAKESPNGMCYFWAGSTLILFATRYEHVSFAKANQNQFQRFEIISKSGGQDNEHSRFLKNVRHVDMQSTDKQVRLEDNMANDSLLFFKDIIAQKIKSLKDGNIINVVHLYSDIIFPLLNKETELQNDKPMPAKPIIAKCSNLMTLLQFIIIELNDHQEYISEIKQEVSSLIENFGDNYLDFNKLHYIQAVIKEAIRLYSFPLIMPYKTQRMTDIPTSNNSLAVGKVKVFKDDVIFVSPFFMQRQDIRVQEPEKFWPDRHFDSKRQIEDLEGYIEEAFEIDGNVLESNYGKFIKYSLTLFLALLYTNYDVILVDGHNLIKEENWLLNNNMLTINEDVKIILRLIERIPDKEQSTSNDSLDKFSNVSGSFSSVSELPGNIDIGNNSTSTSSSSDSSKILNLQNNKKEDVDKNTVLNQINCTQEDEKTHMEDIGRVQAGRTEAQNMININLGNSMPAMQAHSQAQPSQIINPELPQAKNTAMMGPTIQRQLCQPRS